MNSNQPLVTVIIPSYNHSDFIGEAIESVLNQTYKNLELLIADDCSTDNSREIIGMYLDKRIVTMFNKKNKGAAINFNDAILKANGKYIALLNSDDSWELNKLEIQVDFLEKNKEYGAVFTDAKFLDENNNVLENKQYIWSEIFTQRNRSQGEWLQRFFFELNCICHPSMLIRKEVYDGTDLYNPGLRQLPDFKMWVDIVKFTKIYIIDEKLVKFKVLENDKNTSSDTEENRIRNKNEIRLIMIDFFENVSLDLFKEGFGEHLINKEIISEEEMLCEQAFLYLKMQNELEFLYSSLAIEKFYFLFSNKKSRNILEENYGFSINNFYELTAMNNFASLSKFDNYRKNDMDIYDKTMYILKKIKKHLKI